MLHERMKRNSEGIILTAQRESADEIHAEALAGNISAYAIPARGKTAYRYVFLILSFIFIISVINITV